MRITRETVDRLKHLHGRTHQHQSTAEDIVEYENLVYFNMDDIVTALNRSIKMKPQVMGRTTIYCVCPVCLKAVDGFDQYCRHCGQAFDQEEDNDNGVQKL